MLYFDTSYLVRLYTKDAGWEQVRALARTDRLACCLHGQAETAAAFHRKLREGAINQRELRTLLAEFDRDSNAGAYRWLPLSPAVVLRLSHQRIPACPLPSLYARPTPSIWRVQPLRVSQESSPMTHTSWRQPLILD